MHLYTAQWQQEEEEEGGKKSSIYSCGCPPPLLGLHVQHQSIHSGEILRSLHTWKQRNKHAQYTQNTHLKQALIEPWLHCSLSPFFFPFPFLLSVFLSISPCFSLHMWYVTVLFPCPGATYTQGKHRAVCVDDCQQWPFIICQASVL